ncbi:MAG: IS66 family insertion sequence element accessory protein TnpA [Burkholderiales bacterium]
MTATEQKWAERVESWRESGLTSEQYSDGRGFSANGLRHWAYKLGKTERRRPTVDVPEVRIVRVVRGTTETGPVAEVPAMAATPTAIPTKMSTPARAAPLAATPPKAATAPTPASIAVSNASTPIDPSLDIEVGAVRVVVRPGFDRATLVAVLEVLAAHGGTR